MNITQEELKALFHYEPSTGLFTRLIRKGKCKPTSRVGCVDDRGYLKIGINRKYYFAHRLAWLYCFGKQPQHTIDHINGNKLDNSISNLRDVHQRRNTQNRSYHRDGKLVGASYDKAHKLWKSRVWFNNKSFELGSYKTEIEAHQKYIEFLANNQRNYLTIEGLCQ